jgi:membrane associated rhomboid family serine protease
VAHPDRELGRYIMVRGFFDRHPIDMIIGTIMALCFAYQFTVLLPRAGIGWQAHLGGLIGGVAAGWIFRERRPRVAIPDPVTGTAGLSFPGTRPGDRPGDAGSSAP